jgi:DnaJ-class molecular chaperone
MNDFYKVLGVARDASQDEIKKSYRKLAKQYHPDLHKGDKGSEEKFKDVSEAYEVLGDEKKRRQYDQFGQWQAGGAPHAQHQYTYTWPGGGPSAQGPQGFEDIFSEIFGMGGFQQSGFGRAGSPRGTRGRGEGSTHWEAQAPRDLHYSMDINFLQAAVGTEAKIAVDRHNKQEKITVKIPAGIKDKAKIRLIGKGDVNTHSHKAGDLYITLHVKPHDYLARDGNDIHLEVPISIGEAVLGAELKVPTIMGPVTLKIPKGSSSGTRLRLQGKGIAAKGQKVGDQYVTLKIVLPKKIDSNSEKIIKEFSERLVFNPREGKF